MTSIEDRKLILELSEEALQMGVRQAKFCEMFDISERTLQRWQKQPDEGDMRNGPLSKPGNSLTEAEKQAIVKTANSDRFKDKNPAQIVSILLDEGYYIASESSFYRVLRENKMVNHRENTRVKKHSKPLAHIATGPNQVWSWDITYLWSPVRGKYYYLYMIVDIYSRLIVHWCIREDESAEHASVLITEACEMYGVDKDQLILHSDNGGPMKGTTMLATLQMLGVVPSFSRPRVSDDNPFSESLFKTLKYRPEYPAKPFASIESAEAWVNAFVKWYNFEHRHSGIKYVTPYSRHTGTDKVALEKRKVTLEAAKEQNPHRWIQGKVRNCESITEVILNPGKKLKEEKNKSLKKVA